MSTFTISIDYFKGVRENNEEKSSLLNFLNYFRTKKPHKIAIDNNKIVMGLYEGFFFDKTTPSIWSPFFYDWLNFLSMVDRFETITCDLSIITDDVDKFLTLCSLSPAERYYITYSKTDLDQNNWVLNTNKYKYGGNEFAVLDKDEADNFFQDTYIQYINKISKSVVIKNVTGSTIDVTNNTD